MCPPSNAHPARRRGHPHALQGSPGLGVRGAPRRDHARLGAAVDLDDPGAEPRLGLGGERLGKRRRGRQDQIEPGQLDSGLDAGANVQRRGHEHAPPRELGEPRRDVGRKERPARVNHAARLQRQHHGGLEAPHVLRRHGAEKGRALRQPQGPGRGARPGDELPPGLGVRDRPPRAPGREHDCGRLAARDPRHLPPAGEGLEGFRIGERSAVHERHRGLRDAREVRVRLLDLVEQLLGPVRHEQRKLAVHERRAQRHQEAIAVVAQVEQMTAARQARRERAHVGEELPGADAPPGAPRDGLVRLPMRNQRRRVVHWHRASAPDWLGA